MAVSSLVSTHAPVPEPHRYVLQFMAQATFLEWVDDASTTFSLTDVALA